MAKKAADAPPVEPPEEKILPPEAVEAATEAVEEAVERTKDATDFKDQEEVLARLLDVKGLLNGLTEKIDKLGSVRIAELSDEERAAVQVADRSVAEKFLSFLDRCLTGEIAIPDELRRASPPAGDAGRKADQEKGTPAQPGNTPEAASGA